MNVKVNSVKVADQQFIIQLVVHSLLEAQIKDTTEYFKQVFSQIFARRMSLSKLRFIRTFNLNFKFVGLLLHHFRN